MITFCIISAKKIKQFSVHIYSLNACFKAKTMQPVYLGLRLDIYLIPNTGNTVIKVRFFGEFTNKYELGLCFGPCRASYLP